MKCCLPAVHAFAWKGLDETGNLASSGIYFYRINDGVTQVTKQMTLIK